MTLEELWEQHNSKVNTLIGKLSVGAAQSGNPLVKEVHKDLIDFAHWFDEQMESTDNEG